MNFLKHVWKQFKWQISRIWFDILILLFIFWLLLLGPFADVGRTYLANIILSKVILLSFAVVHAHITREFLFPYIKFNTEKSWSNNLMIIAIYVMFIFGYSRGG